MFYREKLQDNGKTAIAERLITYKASIRIAETVFKKYIYIKLKLFRHLTKQ